MLNTPETTADVRKILYKQMELLAEVSEEYKSEPDVLAVLSSTMNNIALTLFKC